MAILTTATVIPSVARGGQTIPVVVRVPTDTSADAAVFVAGSLPGVGGWKADGVLLTRAGDCTYAGEVSVEAGQSLEYKFTRGNWDTGEKSADGGDRPNRVFVAGASTSAINATVER